MNNTLQKLAIWQFLLPTFLILSFFAFYLFPNYQMQLNQIAGEEVPILDTRLSYTQQEVIVLFNKMGAEGRELCSFITGKIDMIYPIIYGLFFILLIAYLLKSLLPLSSNWYFLSYFPLLAVLADYLENFNTLHLLENYQNPAASSVLWGEHFTQMKWFFVILYLSFCLFLSVALLIRKIRT